MAPAKPAVELAARFISASRKLNASTIDLAGTLLSFSNVCLALSNELAGASAIRKLRNADRQQFARLAGAMADYAGQIRHVGDVVNRHNRECGDVAGILATLLELVGEAVVLGQALGQAVQTPITPLIAKE